MDLRGIVLAKGSSRRLPRKNLRLFAGKPMFLHAVEHLLSIDVAPIVDSDDDEILRLAAEAGAEAHRRDAALAGPDEPTITVVAACFDSMGIPATSGALIVQANSPTVTRRCIERVRSAALIPGVDEVMTAYPDRSHNGSVWAVSGRRLQNYGDPYVHRPDVLLCDDSVDIHFAADIDEALSQRQDFRATSFDCQAPDPSISQAFDQSRP